MKILVGLGNPEKKYENTFHNLGFLTADAVAEKLGVAFNKEKCKAMIAETRIGGEKVIMAKPLTYMNLSGESVRELVAFYKIDLSDLLVIYDDYDIEKGEIRIRGNGSAGTHNGMKSVINELKSEAFTRLRIGFHPSGDFKIPLIDYVLSGISIEDKPLFTKAISVASDAAVDFLKGKGTEYIMRQYNGKLSI